MTQAQYVTIEPAGSYCLARITCEKVAEREAGVISTELLAGAPAARARVILDMAGVMLLGSAGLGALVTIDKQLRARGGRLVLFNLRPDILAVMRLTKLDRLLGIAETRDEAIAKLPA